MLSIGDALEIDRISRFGSMEPFGGRVILQLVRERLFVACFSLPAALARTQARDHVAQVHAHEHQVSGAMLSTVY